MNLEALLNMKFINIDSVPPIPFLPDQIPFIANEITKNIPDDRVKAYAIHTWIYDNIKWDASANNGLKEKSAILTALGTKKGTCFSMTMVYVALAKSVGLDARITKVIIDEFGEKIENPGHVCAIVFINGESFLLDPAYKDGDAKHKEVAYLSREDTNKEIIYDITKPYLTLAEKLINSKKYYDAYRCCKIGIFLSSGEKILRDKFKLKMYEVLRAAGYEYIKIGDLRTGLEFIKKSKIYSP